MKSFRAAYCGQVILKACSRNRYGSGSLNDVASSYLPQKLEGTPGIATARMPFGFGSSDNPCLDSVTIDRVKDWMNAGEASICRANGSHS